MNSKIPVAVSAFVTLLNIEVISTGALMILCIIGLVKFFEKIAERGVY